VLAALIANAPTIVAAPQARRETRMTSPLDRCMIGRTATILASLVCHSLFGRFVGRPRPGHPCPPTGTIFEKVTVSVAVRSSRPSAADLRPGRRGPDLHRQLERPGPPSRACASTRRVTVSGSGGPKARRPVTGVLLRTRRLLLIIMTPRRPWSANAPPAADADVPALPAAHRRTASAAARLAAESRVPRPVNVQHRMGKPPS
jgi:hypothetical protein